jgi:RNA polymerase sigma-70 factor (ECF subfamily)
MVEMDRIAGGRVERETVDRARAGDRDAYAELAAASIRPLFAAARLILRDDDLADDATQEALVNAWRYLPSLRDADRFEGWLYRLLVNACRTQLRRDRRRRVVEIHMNPAADAGDPGRSLADRDQLERGFERLDVDERAVVILRYYRGYSVPEVADIVGIPLGTAKSKIHRATRTLRAALEADARVGPIVEGSRA